MLKKREIFETKTKKEKQKVSIENTMLWVKNKLDEKQVESNWWSKKSK